MTPKTPIRPKPINSLRAPFRLKGFNFCLTLENYNGRLLVEYANGLADLLAELGATPLEVKEDHDRIDDYLDRVTD